MTRAYSSAGQRWAVAALVLAIIVVCSGIGRLF